MAANSQILSLIVQATDKASGVLGGIASKLGTVGTAAGAASAKAGGLSDSIAAGMVKARIAVDGVSAAYSKLTGAIQEASSIELDNLNAASGLESFLGSYQEAEKLVGSINKNLAAAAGPLPGSTGDYSMIARSITDDVASAYAKGGKLPDIKAFQGTVESIATSYAAMAATTGTNIGNMQLGLGKLLSGASLSEVFNIDAIGKNIRLKNALEAAVKATGKDLKQLTDEQRIKLIEKVGGSIITPEFLARSQKTLDATWQSFVSGLFDSQGGLFGVMRDLDKSMEGEQTVYESAKATLDKLVGGDGLFSKIGGILGKLGLTADPMAVLKSGIDRFNSVLDGAKSFLDGIHAGFGEGYTDFGEILQSRLRLLRADVLGFFSRIFAFDVKSFGEIGQTLGYNLSASVNRGMQWLNTIDWSKAFSQVGQTIGGAINVAVKSVTGFLAGIDWEQAKKLAGSLTQGLIQGIFSFLGTIDYGAIGQFAIQAIGSLVISGIISLATVVAGGLWTLATTGVPLLVTAIGAGLEGLKTFVVAAITESAGMFGSIISGLWNQLGDAANKGMQALGAKIYDLFNAIAAKIGEAISMVRNNPVSQTIGAVAGAVANPIGTAANVIGSVMPKFEGHVPNAANGLIGAAKAEAKAMPTGARVVVANDSETIIPKGKTLSGGRGLSITNHFTISGDNAKSIAQEVIGIIQGQFEAELATQLA